MAKQVPQSTQNVSFTSEIGLHIGTVLPQTNIVPKHIPFLVLCSEFKYICVCFCFIFDTLLKNKNHLEHKICVRLFKFFNGITYFNETESIRATSKL